MGLDIHAASHLRRARPIPEDEEFDQLEERVNAEGKCLEQAYFLLFPNDPEHEKHLAGLEPGLYEYTAASEQLSFRVGPYSYYNEWRRRLSRFALGAEPTVVWKDPDRFAGRPFVELIDFTDADGRVGTRLAAKLAADFRTQMGEAERFAATLDDGESFLGTYRDFARAFEVAAQAGVVAFC